MIARAAAALIVVLYAVLGLVVLRPEAVYSGDIGVKYVQAQALVEHRFGSLDIPYPGQVVDPERQFFPMRPPFVMAVGGETQSIFPPASSVLQAAAVAVGGFRGMIALSIAAAAVVLFSACALAPPRYRLAVAIAVGVGGPLWFYAVSGWEHAPAVALGTAAFACAVRPGDLVRWPWRGFDPGRQLAARAAPFAAGALLGAGAALRDEVVLLMPGLLIVLWLRTRAWRPLAMAVAGVIVPLALAAAVEVWWFNRPPAAHVRHAVHILQAAFHVTDEPNPELPVLRPMTARERYDTVVTYWLFGRGTDRQVAAFVAALLAALVIRWRWRSSLGILAWVLAFAATAAGDLWEVVTAPKWLAGLVRVSPFVVFAILPYAAGSRDRTGDGSEGERWLPAAIAVTAACYLIVAFAGVDTSGGKSLGPRLLLPLLPLVAVSSMMIVASYLRSGSLADRLVGWSGTALVAMAVAIHAAGTIPAYRYRNADDASAVIAAASSTERIVVADDMYTAQLLFPLYDRKIILLADTIDLGERLGARLAAARLSGALLVSRNPEPAIGLPPLQVERTDQHGRMVVQRWRR